MSFFVFCFFWQENAFMDVLGNNNDNNDAFLFLKIRLKKLTIEMSIVSQETPHMFLVRGGAEAA